MSSVTTHRGEHRYRAFGLNIASSISLPELQAGADPADVFVRLGTMPSQLPDFRKGVRFQTKPGQLFLSVEGVAQFLIKDGLEIVIQPAPTADADSLRIFLLGSALGALLHQRGVLPLHASAINVDGRCAAFLGYSGAGKSTLAAALHKRGYAALADDICAVTLSSDRTPRAHPAYPQLKLWPDALAEIGQPVDGLSRIRPTLEKRALVLPSGYCTERLPISRLYVLSRCDGEKPSISPITGAKKFVMLNTHTYRPQFLDGPEMKKSHFDQCVAVATRVPLARLSRPRHPFLVDELVRLLEQDFNQ